MQAARSSGLVVTEVLGDHDFRHSEYRGGRARSAGLRRQGARRQLHRHRGDVSRPVQRSRVEAGYHREYIGTWIEKNPALRSEIVLATKVAGYNPGSETGGNRFVPPKPKADCRLDRESV